MDCMRVVRGQVFLGKRFDFARASLLMVIRRVPRLSPLACIVAAWTRLLMASMEAVIQTGAKVFEVAIQMFLHRRSKSLERVHSIASCSADPAQHQRLGTGDVQALASHFVRSLFEPKGPGLAVGAFCIWIPQTTVSAHIRLR